MGVNISPCAVVILPALAFEEASTVWRSNCSGMLQIKAKKFMLFVFMCSFHFNRRQIIFRRGFLSLFDWLNKKLNEMNKHIKTLLFALLVSAGITASINTKAQSANESFSVFYN